MRSKRLSVSRKPLTPYEWLEIYFNPPLITKEPIQMACSLLMHHRFSEALAIIGQEPPSTTRDLTLAAIYAHMQRPDLAEAILDRLDSQDEVTACLATLLRAIAHTVSQRNTADILIQKAACCMAQLGLPCAVEVTRFYQALRQLYAGEYEKAYQEMMRLRDHFLLPERLRRSAEFNALLAGGYLGVLPEAVGGVSESYYILLSERLMWLGRYYEASARLPINVDRASPWFDLWAFIKAAMGFLLEGRRDEHPVMHLLYLVQQGEWHGVRAAIERLPDSPTYRAYQAGFALAAAVHLSQRGEVTEPPNMTGLPPLPLCWAAALGGATAFLPAYCRGYPGAVAPLINEVWVDLETATAWHGSCRVSGDLWSLAEYAASPNPHISLRNRVRRTMAEYSWPKTYLAEEIKALWQPHPLRLPTPPDWAVEVKLLLAVLAES